MIKLEDPSATVLRTLVELAALVVAVVDHHTCPIECLRYPTLLEALMEVLVLELRETPKMSLLPT